MISQLGSLTAGLTLAEIEALAIRASFERHGGRRRAMMRELGVSRSTLLRKLAALGLRAREPASFYANIDDRKAA